MGTPLGSRWEPHPGSAVWFWSGEGIWKPAIVVELVQENGFTTGNANIRLRVGEKVTIIRPLSKCKRRAVKRDGFGSLLTEQTAQEALRLLEDGWLRKDVAKLFGVVPTTITMLAQGKSWKHLKRQKAC